MPGVFATPGKKTAVKSVEKSGACGLDFTASFWYSIQKKSKAVFPKKQDRK
jgi:hypothetical protein